MNNFTSIPPKSPVPADYSFKEGSAVVGVMPGLPSAQALEAQAILAGSGQI